MSIAPVIDGDRVKVHFNRFDLPSYDLFLRVKRLPEYTVDFHETTETYTVSAPARFAPMLGVPPAAADAKDLGVSDYLFDDQRAIVRMALDAKRFAVWSDCGLGKTAIMLEWARHVMHRTGGRVLIVTLNEIVRQTVEECRKFYGEGLPVFNLTSRDQMRVWAAGGLPDLPRLGVVNYEKFNPDRGRVENQVVNEIRHLAGIVLDESQRLANSGGKQKWAIIKSARGVEFKLSCTATPAPNATMEFASQASFLEKLRCESLAQAEGEIIWTYFVRDPKTHRWTVRPHARQGFFEFLSGWSICVRDPRRYGWRKDFPEIPAPVILTHEIEMTAEQEEERRLLSVAPTGQLSLYQDRDTNTVQRGKLSQLAKGFLYLKGPNAEKADGRRKIRLVPSLKPAFVANLVRDEASRGLQVLVWTVFDAESDLIADRLADLGVRFALLTGKTKDAERLDTLERFRGGELPVLVSRANMLGFGLNFQCCGSMVFSGWTDSYVSWYQAIRRAYRYGQTKRLRVHVPVIRDLEGDMLDTIARKDGRHLREAEEMETNFVRARRALEGR